MLIGGKIQNGSRSDEVWTFDPVTHEIEELPSMPKALSGIAAVIIGSKVFVMGGNDGS